MSVFLDKQGRKLWIKVLTLYNGCCRGADKAARDVLGQNALAIAVRKGSVADEDLFVMLSWLRSHKTSSMWFVFKWWNIYTCTANKWLCTSISFFSIFTFVLANEAYQWTCVKSSVCWCVENLHRSVLIIWLAVWRTELRYQPATFFTRYLKHTQSVLRTCHVRIAREKDWCHSRLDQETQVINAALCQCV